MNSNFTFHNSVIQFKKSFAFVFLLFVFHSNIHAQKYWMQLAGGATIDEASDITVDANNNSISTGYFTGQANFGSSIFLTSSGITDIFICSNASNGDFSWAKKAGGAGLDKGNSIGHDGNGNIYVTGYYSATATFDATTLTSVGLQDVFVAKYNSTGSLQWAVSCGGTGNDIGNAIAVDNSGNVFVTGQFVGTSQFGSFTLTSQIDWNTSQSSIDVFTIKLDNNGTVLWAKKGSSPHTDRGFDIAIDALGNAIICGQFSDTVTFDAAHISNMSNAIFLVKYDASGNEVWFDMAGGGIYNTGYTVAVDAANNIYMAGDFSGNIIFFGTPNVTVSNTYSKRIFLAKYNSSGILNWVEADGSVSDISCRAIAIDNNSDVFITGFFMCKLNEYADVYGQGTFNSIGFNDIFVARYDSSGNRLWMRNGGSRMDDFAYGISVDSYHQAHIAGSVFDQVFFPASINDFVPGSFVNSYGLDQYCNENNYATYCSLIPAGNADILIANPIDTNRNPYDYYQRSGVVCVRDFVGVEITGLINDTVTFCGSGDLTPDAHVLTTIAPLFNYQWSNGSTNNSINVTSTGNYGVMQVSADGCFTSYDTAHVIVHPIPSQPLITDSKGVNVSAVSPQQIIVCAPDTIILTASGFGADSVYWTGVCGSSSSYIDTVICSSDSCSGSYFVGVVNQFGCVNGNYVYIIVQEPFGTVIPFFAPQTDTVLICNHVFGITMRDSITAIPIACDSTHWTMSPPFSQTSNYSNIAQQSFYIPQSGWYHFSCTSFSHNTCDTDTQFYEQDYYILVDSAPVINLTCTNAFFCLSGDTVMLVASGGTNYSWSGLGIISDPTNDTIWVTNYGTFVVSSTAVSPGGCSGSTNCYTYVSPYPQPTIAMLPASGLVCPNDSVYLSASSGSNYTWYGPLGLINDTTQNIYVNTSGFYYCVVTISDCDLLSNTVEVKQYATPFLQVLPSNILCGGDSATITVITNPGSSLTWLPPLTGNSLTQVVNTPGVYLCDITSCGIVTHGSATVVASTVSAVITPSGIINLCDGDSIVLTAPNGMAQYTWLPDSLTTQTITVYQAGTYSLQTIDAGNCTASSSVVVTVQPVPQNPVINSNSPLCAGDTLSLSTSTVIGVNYLWNGPANFSSSSITNLIIPASTINAGNYFLVAYNAACSSDTQNVFVQIDSISVDASITNAVPICYGNPLQLNITISDSSVQFNWQGPDGFISIIQNPLIAEFNQINNGIYQVVLTKGACTSIINKNLNGEDCDFTIPNVFTPNGDGINETFSFSGTDIDDLRVDIYDRWGLLIKSLNSKNDFWDGTNNAGNKVPDGVYYYLGNLKFISGDEQSVKGFVQLIR